MLLELLICWHFCTGVWESWWVAVVWVRPSDRCGTCCIYCTRAMCGHGARGFGWDQREGGGTMGDIGMFGLGCGFC